MQGRHLETAFLWRQHCEKMGIVQRTIHPQDPPKVEYQLTEIGEALRPTLRALLDWADLIAIDFIIAIPFCNSIHWDWG